MFGDKLTAFVFPLLLFLLRLGRFKTVVTVHAVVPINDVNSFFATTFAFPKKLHLLLKMWFIVIYSSISMLASAIIVHAAYSRKVMVGDYKTMPEKIFVAPIGVSEYFPIELRKGKWFKVLEGKKSILFFGYLVDRKGVEYLIEAFDRVSRRFPDLLLVIAGGVLSYSSPYVKRLTDLINRLGVWDRVVFLTTTPFPIDELHELYELSEFVVLPYTYSISSSLALSFAMQHGKPVIVTDIGVFKEEIDNKVEGLLCAPSSTDSLEKAIEEIIKSEDLRKTLSNNIRKKAEMRSWSSTARKNLQVYSYILVSKH
jgi:glycosyltransferase involved in cell wall biosynthesis